jgi:hypothetical protein
MAYIGVSPSNGVRRVHTYTATASQTTFSGAGAEGTSLSYKDSNFVDVYQNGIKLGDADYTSTSGTSIVLAQGASVDDLVVVVVFDVFSVADTVSKADGGTFDGAVTLAGGVAGGVVFNDDSESVDFRIESNDDANMFFLDGSANAIGIRTSTDYGGQLNVETTGQAYNVVLACTDDDANNGPLLDFYRNSSSPADSDLLGEISFRGRNDNSQDVNYGHISGKIIDASDGTEDGMLDISTIKNGTKVSRIKITDDGTVINEDGKDIDFRVESDVNPHAFVVDAEEGDIFINGSAFASGANRKQFEINSNATALRSGCSATTTQFHEEFHNPNGTVGSISTNGSSTSFNTSSDYRLKENVVTDWNATSRLKQLKPSRFNFIADANTTIDGFLAHEVSSIVPEAVTGEKDAVDDDDNIVPQSIDQSKLVPLLTKTLQEALTRIDTLEADVKALKGE